MSLYYVRLNSYYKSSYQIRLHRNDKKTAPGTENAESEGEKGNLNNSDTNANDITQRRKEAKKFLQLIKRT